MYVDKNSIAIVQVFMTCAESRFEVTSVNDYASVGALLIVERQHTHTHTHTHTHYLYISLSKSHI